MLKIVVFAALAATVLADGHRKSEHDIALESSATVARKEAVQVKADTIAASATFLGQGLKMNQESIDRYGDAGQKVADITEKIGGAKLTVDDLLKKTVDGINSKLEQRKATLINNIKARIAKLDVAGKMQNTDKSLTGDITKINEALKAIQTNNKASSDAESSISGCTSKQQMFNPKTKKCVDIKADSTAHMQKVSHHGFDGGDGRDCGYLNHRVMQFEKKEDDSHVRVFYYDNLRVHGHTAHARWNVMFCKDNQCGHCSTPGRIQNWRYSSHQHNWWMNDHQPGTAFGLCKKADNVGDLKAGSYEIKIMLDNCRYDIHTGSDYGSIMVDEVMRY